MQKTWNETSLHISDAEKQWVNETLRLLEKKMSRMTVRSRDKLADGVDENGFHVNLYPEKKQWWTNGFWGGMNLLMYQYTGNEEYLKTARRSEEMLEEVAADFRNFSHDVGFSWHILSGADYRLTGNRAAGNRNLYMAAALASRFVLCENGGFIQAWSKPRNGEDTKNWSIVDTMMNLSILYWASEELQEDRFRRFAVAHADMVLRDHIRPDGSVQHIVEHDRQTGAAVRYIAGSAYGENTAWSRGTGWAVYGMMISYRYTHEQRFLDAAKRVAHYFVSACAEDYLPRADFRAPDDVPVYDTSAACIACCGLIEIAKAVPAVESKMYLLAALRILHAVTEKFSDFDPDNDHIIDHATRRLHMLENDIDKNAVHISIIYADYFYTEALLKLAGSEFCPW